MKAKNPSNVAVITASNRVGDAYYSSTTTSQPKSVIDTTHKAGYSSTITVAMLTQALDDMRDKIMQQVSDELSRIETVIMDALQR